MNLVTDDFPVTPLVTYHVISFNRLPFLRNLLESFRLCNVYPHYEWIITDYGSKDGSCEFLQESAAQDSHLRVLYKDEKEYFDDLKAKGLEPKFQNQKLAAIASHFRNEVRRMAKGDLFVDLADDHQFIRRGDWVREALSIYGHRIESQGRDDATGIVTRAFMYARHLKKSNVLSPLYRTDEGIEYFVYEHKGYDVYCMMKRSTFQKLGPFKEIDQLTDPDEVRQWKNNLGFIDLYPDYVKKAALLGMKRITMKFPYVVEFPNEIIKHIHSDTEPPFCPLFQTGEMEEEFSKLSQPVSSDEIFFAKGIRGFRAPEGQLARRAHLLFKRFGYWVRSE